MNYIEMSEQTLIFKPDDRGRRYFGVHMLTPFYDRINPYTKLKREKDIHDLEKDLTEETATKILTNLIPFVNSRPMNLAILLGVSYDVVRPDDDRRRFKDAVKFLLNAANEGEETLVVSIDPSFMPSPQGYDKLRTISACLASLLEDDTDKGATIIIPKVTITVNNNPVTDWLQYSSVDKETKKELSKYLLLTCTLMDMATKKSAVFHFIFLKYPLTSAYSKTPFDKRQNLFNIHSKEKTIETYIANEQCQYKDGGFYKAIEQLATQPTIQTVYFASAASAHTKSALIKNGEYYLPEKKLYEFGYSDLWYTDNRYLQGICDVLTLMRKIATAGKSVFFITLDTKQPAFAHPSIRVEYDPLYEKQAYAVPFLEDTTFDLSNPFISYGKYDPTKNNPFIPHRKVTGGKRTRKTSKKRSTRKHKRRV